MKLSTQPYKGTRDFYPDEMRVRNWMFGKWRKACEQFGYEEYDGPILEPLELFASKTSDEIVNEQTYSFTDRGERKVVMRPEMTPTVSRMVAAKRQELAYPLRLYSIPNCFRYERPQKGRLREFWQLNADIFGVDGLEADLEIIMLADAVMKAFNAKPQMYEFKVGSRQLTNWLIGEYLQIDKQAQAGLIRLIDKKDKLSGDDFTGALEEGFSNVAKKIEDLLKVTVLKDLPGGAPVDDLANLLASLQKSGINATWDVGMMRGFDYYTNIVFEVFDTNPENNRSMFGGGRYDGLVGAFGVEPVPTAGFGMGDAPLMNFLESNNLIPEPVVETDLYIATIGDVASRAQDVAQQLRKQGLNVAVDLSGKKLDKQIKTAEKKSIQNVLFVGEEELKTKQFNIKNLKTGDEHTLSLEEVVKHLA